PPSAWMTSQSIQTVREPSAFISATARSDRPIRRWISCVRPEALPRVASLCVRWSVARGIIPYSEVIHPWLVSRRKGGTLSSTLAVQMTCVWPILMSAEPSAWMLTPVWMSTGRMSRSLLPSCRCIRPPKGASALNVDLLEPLERPAEKARPDLAEPFRRVGHEEMVAARGARPLVQEPALDQAGPHDRGRRPRRIDQSHQRSDRGADDSGEERVVRAPQDQGVDPLGPEVTQVRSGRGPRDVIIHPTLLRQRHEQRAGAADDARLRQVAGDGARVGAAL